MDNIKKVLKIDLLEKYSVIKNEIQSSNITLDYLNSLSISGNFFQMTFDTTEVLRNNIKSINTEIENAIKLLDNDQLWNFINERARILRSFKAFVDSIGVIQKSLASRLGSLPHFFPPPPILRQQEIFKALRMLDSITSRYDKDLKKLLEDNRQGSMNGWILPVWDYMVDDKFVMLKNDNYSIELIKSTYWIVLLPRFLPILAHEVAHGYLNANEDKIFAKFRVNKVKESLYRFFSGAFPQGADPEMINSFVGEIISDILALFIAGPTYIFSIFLYLLKEKVNYKLYGTIESFSFLRLKLLASFAISKLREGDHNNNSECFHDYLLSIARFCDDYYQLLEGTEIKKSISRGIFQPAPNIYSDCEIKTFVDKALFEILLPQLREIFKKLSMVGKYKYTNMLNITKEFEKEKYILSYTDLKRSGITNVTDIPTLLWHFILSDTNKNITRYESGRLCQDTFRLIGEERNNVFVLNKKEEEFKIGRVVEFLFMKLNWLFINDFDNPKKDIHKLIKNKLITLGGKNNGRDDFLTIETDGEKISVSSPYDCLGCYDFLLITTDFSVKKLGRLDWPPDFTNENHDTGSKNKRSSDKKSLKYFPKSEVFQEILLPGHTEYSKTLEDFLSDANEIFLYQIQIQAENASDLASSIMLTLNFFRNLREDGIPNLEIFLMKSIGWEDIVILFKNFNGLSDIKKIKERFSNSLRYSLTTLFYKDIKLKSSSRIGKATVVSLLKVNNYEALYKLRKQQSQLYDPLILTGLYDCQLTWKLDHKKTIKDLDKCIVDFIKDHRELEIIDIYSSIAF